MDFLLKYLQMKLKGLSNLDGPGTPHILLNIVFLIDMFYDFCLPGIFLLYSVPFSKNQYLHNENFLKKNCF